jgi:hypothetical protein
MTCMTVRVVNTTNEELLLDDGPPSPVRPPPPRRIGPHATGEFRTDTDLCYLLGGDPDRAIFMQLNGAVWAPPTSSIRAAAGPSALEVEVSPAPWVHAPHVV